MGSMMTGSITTTGGTIVVVLGELVFSGVAGVEGGGVEGVRGARGRVGIIVSVVVVVVSPS